MSHEVVVQDAVSEIDVCRRSVIRSPGEWQVFWAEAFRTRLPVPDAPVWTSERRW